MPEHRFSHPRVVPAAVAEPPRPDSARPAAPAAPGRREVVDASGAPRADSASPGARAPRSQRELVAASLVRCPPRDGRLPGRLTR
jgi:hypothetical protein